MVKRKPIRTRGKLPLSKYFQVLESGDRVAVVAERGVASFFPKRLQGRTGVVEGKKGKSIVIKIKDNNKEKTHIIEAIHLKKINSQI